MPVYISLLRGINVGGNKRIKMAELKDLYESLGLMGTQTLLQSGNAVFYTGVNDAAAVADRIETGIKARFGFESRIILRTVEAFRAVVEKHPYSPEQLKEPKKILVMFLRDVPDADAIAQLKTDHQGREEITIIGQEAYLFYTDGMGLSKLDNNFIERRLKCSGTGRNWNTTNHLLELALGFEPSS